MFSFRICHVVDRGYLPDGYRLVLHKVTNLRLVWECILVVVNRFGTKAVSVAIFLRLLLLSLLLWTISESHFYLSNIQHQRIVNLLELLIHLSYNVGN